MIQTIEAQMIIQAIELAQRTLNDAAVPAHPPRYLAMTINQMKGAGMTDDQIALAMREKGYETGHGTIYGYDFIPAGVDG